MISYFVSHCGTHTIRNYLASAGKALATLFDILPYDDLYRCTTVEGGTCIFAALDQVSDVQRQVLPEPADQLVRAGVRVPNDPRHVRLRYELLRALNAAGQNEFAVYRATAAANAPRFPVFVRDELGSNAPLGAWRQ
jgi:hypothetical protein